MTQSTRSSFRLTRRAAIAAPILGLLNRRAHAFKPSCPVVRVPVLERGLIGTLFLPAGPSDLPAVVCLAGAMGGLTEAPAHALAADGFPALALATHGVEGRPERLRLLPLDYVEDAVEWVRARSGNGHVALRGWSRGGELALLLASFTPSVAAVLAYAPRCYVGLEHGKPNNFNDPTAAPAWTWRGRPVEVAPLPPAMWADPKRWTFEETRGIPVENIRGPIMLVSGGADTGLAGTTARFGCESVMRRLALYRFAYPHLHLTYPDAGHAIAGPPPFEGPAEEGGTPAGNAAAVADSWPRSIAFLRQAGSA
jgi:dienelactone hydrolase